MSSGKTLYLPIKKKWFDMIKSGEKKEEYREIKQYWRSRIRNVSHAIVEFRNGYYKTDPSFRIQLNGVRIGYGKKKWGAPSKKVYILELGNII